MILKRYLNNDINQDIEAIQYFGEDLKNFEASEEIKNLMIDNIYKECETYEGHRGFIIGIEDNYKYKDYYYIIWIPHTQEICYELSHILKLI